MNKETLKAVPFDALEVLNTETGESTYDRVSYADDIARYFSSFTTNGVIVMGGNVLGDQFKVTHTTGLKVSVATGSAVIDGRVCWRDEVGEDLTLDIGEPDPRIDRIVLELNKLKDDRAVYLKVLKGIAGAVPVAPTLTRTTDVYQLSLAQVLVEANQAIIATVTDERPDEAVCGLANITLGIKPPTGMDAVTVQLEPETQALYGVGNVDDALKRAIVDFSSYQAFCANVNATSLDSAFGKNNEGEMYSLGKQLAMYAWFKGDSKASHPFTYLQKKKNLVDALSDPYSYAEIILNTNLLTLIEASPYANGVYNTSSYKTNDLLNVQALAVASGTPSPTQYNTINELFTSDGSNVVQSTKARAFATNNPHVTSLMGVSTICSDVMIANPVSLLAWLTDISVYRTAFANLRYNYNAMYANRTNMNSILSNSAVRTAIASSALIVSGPDVDANGTQLIGKTLLAIDNSPKLLVRLNLSNYGTSNYTLTGGVDGNFTSSGLDCYVWSTGASAVSCTATTAAGGEGGTATVGQMRYIKTT